MKRTLVVVALLVVGLGGALLLVPRTPAQITLSVEPTMTKGPADARVTIIEFSDYQ